MSATLRIAKDMAMPLDAVTSTFAALGIRGSGKTTAVAVLCEELLEQHIPVAILDPTGAHWGLRSSASGKRAGYPVVIFGGEHADVPLDAASGEMIANLLVEERIPAILDLSLLRKAQMREWVADFLETLYRRNRDALHVVIDEANLLAPQRTFPGSERALGAVEDVVLRGRIRGIGVSLVSQRAASLNKSVLTQVETLILLRTTGRPDIAAIDEWIANHADPEQGRTVKASLASLPTGTAWIWSPHFLSVLKKVAIRARTTFDSSATPRAGQARITPERWANINIAALGEKVQTAVEKAKEADPARLRARVRELERALAGRGAATAELEAASEREQQLQEQLRQRDHALDSARRLIAELRSGGPTPELLAGVDTAWAELADRFGQLRKQLDQPIHVGDEDLALVEDAPHPQPTPPAVATRRPAPARATKPGRAAAAGAVLPKSHRAVLSALAPYAPGPRSKRQVAVMSGYAVNGGGFNNAISALRSAGLIEGANTALRATDAGLESLGDFEPLPTGEALLEHWVTRLPKAPKLILQALAAAWPSALTKEQLAERTQYEPAGGGFNNAISRLRTLELISGPGSALRAADDFFTDTVSP